MLKQEELAFLKVLSSIEPSSPLFREMRKAIAAKKTSKVIASSKAKTFCVTLFKRHATVTGAGSERQSSPRKTSQPVTGKRKAEESASSDGLTTPAAKRPAPDPLVSETPGTSGEHKPERSRQQAAIEGKPEYAAVVAGHTNHQQPSGQPKPKVNGLEPSKPAVSPDAATRRMSCEDMSGPLCSMELTPPRLRPSPAGERPNKTSSQESLKHVIFSRGYGRYASAACRLG